MEMNKKNALLLGVLLVVLVFVGFYKFYYEPKKENIALLEIEKMDKQQKLDEMQAKILQEPKLDTQISESMDTIEQYSSKMFVNLKQEEALKISNILATQNMVIDSVSFADSVNEENNINVVDQTIAMDSDYLSIMEYMAKIRNYDKNIAITSISFSKSGEAKTEEGGSLEEKVETQTSSNSGSGGESGENESLLGMIYSTPLQVRMTLRYSSVPSLATLGKVDNKLIYDVMSKRDMAEGPFNAYEGYVDSAQEKATEEIQIETETNPFDYENYKPRTPVYDFEDGSAFFVGNESDTVGHVVRSKTRMSGGYSADLTFDFVTAREYNSASLVFENNRITLSKQPEKLFMNIYAYEGANHKIGFEILDSSGKDYKLYIADDVDWTDWQEVEVDLPSEITYPCIVRRIFVEGVGYGQKLTGRYLFDRLEAQFP